MPLARVGEWQGRTVEVTARLIPRCLWTTASIDVYIDSACVLETGGKFEATGSSYARFYHSGATHDIELHWGIGVTGFPIEITIDGQAVAESRVRVDNWPLGMWPCILLVGAVAWAFSGLWR